MKRAALVLALALTGCGARTELGAPESFDASVPDVAHDAAHPEDVIVTDSGCTSDAQCDDGLACTVDACDPALRVCTHAPRSALCDDGVFCDGDEVCDPSAGCTTIPRNCADSVTCTVDTCDEQNQACVHAPDDSLCPISHVCDPVLGCQAHALAHDDTTLYDVRLPSGQVNVIGATQSQLTDIALSPSNQLFGIGFGALYTVSQQNGTATFAKNLSGGSLNGADFAPDGTLWVSGGSSVYTANTVSGTLMYVASFPPGMTSSGDLAWVGTRLLATAVTGGGDDLVEVSLITKTSTVIGATGFTCIWGLAAFGTTLYGLTCEGRVLSIDTTTGKATQLNTSTATFWGASAR